MLSNLWFFIKQRVQNKYKNQGRDDFINNFYSGMISQNLQIRKKSSNLSLDLFKTRFLFAYFT